ncbi:hypothetical protein M8998_06690 [Sphingobacterium sp. lm-10]|uniref:calcium:proton antiporter n=1 Tax=Sphingobacterium sp. lm-10 TaxID=2944904 RepID=UPI0020228D68|nr:hypothetical protein [Sphingobacterium sp. lm-10]MCL7987621.1 hypothetical protein [Sphingobacterium sp. lm-10]
MKQIIPIRTLLRLAFIWAVVGLLFLFGDNVLGTGMSYGTAGVSFTILLITIIIASFGVVKEADQLAHLLGEPYGTLILTLSIVSIEVVLIAAVLLGPAESPDIGKDAIFSVMMIIMNLVIGLCILLGSIRHKEQEYNAQGTLTYFAMIVILGGIALILPNYIVGKGLGEFTTTQSIFISVLVLMIYGMFLKYQTTDYRHLYIQPKLGSMRIPYPRTQKISPEKVAFHKDADKTNSSKKEVVLRSMLLVLMILPIVLLSHDMAVVVDFGIQAAKLPLSLGGVLIAIIVFTPESMTAIKAARNNEFQRAINLCHGAFVSTVGLTVPAVLIIGLFTTKVVRFGLTSTEIVLFILTLLLSLVSFQGKRTTPILGIIHLALFAVFILLLFNP